MTTRTRTKKAPFLAAAGAALVGFSYFWMDQGLILTLALDAIAWVTPGAQFFLEPLWVIVGLLTLIALPVWASSKWDSWRDKRRRRS